MTGSAAEIPLADGLFTWPAETARLLGSRCDDCGAHTFPGQDACPRCASANVAVVELSPRGTVWTWTSQEFRPPSPPYAGPEEAESFRPYYVGYVELADELRVEARFSGFEDGPPAIGQSVELAILPFRVADDGAQIMIYTFQPVAEAADA